MAVLQPLQDAKTSEALRGFANYKKTVQNRAVKTVDEYLMDLRIFFKFIKAKRADLPQIGDEFYEISISDCDYAFMSGITPDEIYDYLTYLREDRGISARSSQRKLSAVKSLFKFAVSTGKISNNPARDIDTAAVRNSLPKYLTLDESKELLYSINSEKDNATKLRDFAIVLCFLNTGMRLSELCGINIEDFDKSWSSLVVTGKRSKQRIIYINDSVKEAIKAYMMERVEKEGEELIKDQKGKHPLFVSTRMQRISPKTVQHLVNKHLERAGLGYKQVSTHKLRHTAATLMYREGGVDVRVLQEILGHQQLNTTQIYTHIASRDMEQATKKNPLATFDPDDND